MVEYAHYQKIIIRIGIMDIILYGGIMLGVGVVCSLGYRIARKKKGATKETSAVMNKINDFYSMQDNSKL